jgi:hypothetical protein
VLQPELVPAPAEVWYVSYFFNDNAGKAQVLSAFFDGRPTLDQFLLQAEASQFNVGPTITVLRILRAFVANHWEELHYQVSNEMLLGAPRFPVSVQEPVGEPIMPTMHVEDLMKEQEQGGGAAAIP